jgi:hypothetical protein
MGINDRDYMRRSDSEPAEAPRSIAREGVTLAVCIVIGMLIVGGASGVIPQKRKRK